MMKGMSLSRQRWLVWVVVVWLALCPWLAWSAALGKKRHDTPEQRVVMIYNQSGRRIDALWVNIMEKPSGPSQDYPRLSHSEGVGIPVGGESALSSYIGHEFDIVELPQKSTGKCLYSKCRKGYFKVNAGEDQGTDGYLCIYVYIYICMLVFCPCFTQNAPNPNGSLMYSFFAIFSPNHQSKSVPTTQRLW